jgi:hypothetical protein
MRLFLVLFLAAGVPALALAQEAPEGDDVRSADEIPEDMPDPPEDAPPAEAPPVDGTDERPPHPETPEDLEELQPTAETLGKTSYHWLPGHWMWTGEQFEWKSGEWVYKVKDMILVPPRWEWDGKQWVFHDAGWAKSGTKKVVYRATPAPGGPDIAANAEQPPAASTETVEPQASTTTVYVYTGVYVAPLILYPIWHPHYHYHWYHTTTRTRTAQRTTAITTRVRVTEAGPSQAISPRSIQEPSPRSSRATSLRSNRATSPRNSQPTSRPSSRAPSPHNSLQPRSSLQTGAARARAAGIEAAVVVAVVVAAAS